MIERDVLVPTKFGHIPTFAVYPEGIGEFPAIIFYMDGNGIREILRDMARRIAKQGYFCLLPDLYYRLGTIRFDLSRRFEGGRDILLDVMRACSVHLSNELVMEDTAGLLNFIDAQDKVKPGPIGCVGHCLSGRFVVTAAARFADRIAAAASLYGVGVVTDKDDSPHKFLKNVKGELYFGFAERDETIPKKVIRDLTAALEHAGTRYALDVYPADHGFCFPERAAYDPVAAEQSWDRVFALWERTLK